MPTDTLHWRLDFAVLQDWSKNGYYLPLQIPTVAEMRSLNIHVADDWDGVRAWRGKIAEQADPDLRLFLPGGSVQLVVDFSNQHNAPVKEWIRKAKLVKKTNWQDLDFTRQDHAIMQLLQPHERSAKISIEGYADWNGLSGWRVGTETTVGEEE